MIEVLMSITQTEYRAKGERIFKIKLGDEIVHTVDVVSEAGYGKILHKWIEFDIREDVAFLNGTLVHTIIYYSLHLMHLIIRQGKLK